MKVNKNIELLTLLVISIIAFISAVVVIVGFFIRDASLVIGASRFLSLSTLCVLSYFGWGVYQEMFTKTKEVRFELRSREDVEEFRIKMERELQQYIKEIAEEEELDKNKDE